MTALASVEDVKRILRIPASSVDAERDARIAAALRAVEAWASNVLKKLGKEGNQVEVYFDRREDETLHLPSADVTVTKVKVFEYPSASGIPISSAELGLGHGYDMDDQGRLMLRPVLGYSPFEGAMAERVARYYSRIEVHYIGSGVVPADVTEGIAFMAAAYYETGPKILSGVTSERIGDYSYTIGGGAAGETGEMTFLAQGLFFLRNYMNTQRVAVV